jgi:NAD(P)-dependent dehydrogenase (short-subunit alcohol dehydrogenase family)
MDKIDGPYYFFKAIQKARHALPEWFPLVGIEVGKTNIVPVDYVAAAMDHIAHQPGLDGQAFHLVDPKMKRAGDVINTFAEAGHAPKMVIRVDKNMTDMLPKGVLSYDRFHDYERTVQLNYLGTIKLIIAVLPHMREKKSGHIVNVSSIGVQTKPPRFSAYVASKAALDSFTRVVSSETIGDNVTFTTIHMPLVRTPMIAPTKIYDSFPTISPEEAADLVCEAIRSKPKQLNTRLGTFGEVAYALAPKAVDQILHMAYKVFPESTKKDNDGKDGEGDQASGEAMALAHLMKGVHW